MDNVEFFSFSNCYRFQSIQFYGCDWMWQYLCLVGPPNVVSRITPSRVNRTILETVSNIKNIFFSEKKNQSYPYHLSLTMPFRFPVKFEIPKHAHLNARVLRDQFKRLQVAEHEVTRNALKYIARNEELPARARVEAQLQLASMPKYTSAIQIKDRCVASGNAKSVIRDFKLNRTEFRNRARAGLIPGVKVASW